VRIDALLVSIVEKLLGELGDVAQNERAGVFAATVGDWPSRNVLDFIDQLRRVTGDEYMGLGASPCALGASDFVIELGARCETLRDAVRMGFRFMGIATRAIGFELVEAGDRATITIRQAPSARDPGHVLADWAMIVWHKLPQWLIGEEIWLDRTEFDHPLDTNYSAYTTMFGAECVFNSDACRLVFARSYLDRRVIRRPTQGDQLKATTPGYFAKPAFVARSWRQLIRNALRAEITEGHSPATIERLADEFGVSAQTLRRRLNAEGASYRSLKAEARLEIARDVLADGSATLSEASIAAGFAEPNALTRALRASKGLTSQDLREQLLRWRAPDDAPEDERAAAAGAQTAEGAGAPKRPA
jgi:AraC-like DNA-binding protein